MIELKITIPTYNRPEYIQRQVRDVLGQLRNGVSLIVYDNCSDIPVESYFSDEEKQLFTIVRNKFNIGGVANIGKCLAENGDGGWIWLLGDDDKIAKNAVDTILEIIEKHKDCCYINFQQKRSTETKDFREFLNYFKILGAFNCSFFQSACLFNMDYLRPYVRYYYEFITSMVGQIAMVIKYLEQNNEQHCLFTTDRIIEDANVGGWSHLALITNSSLLIDKFSHIRPIMKGTLFKALGDMSFTLLAQEDAPYFVKRKYRQFLVKRIGLFNVVRYNIVTYGQYVLSVIMPKPFFNKIRSMAAGRYNSKVKIV